MQDRYIKWAPFNAIINDKKIKNEIIKKQSKINKPTLSEDQIMFLNEKIFEAYTNHIKVNIFIFNSNTITKLTGFINSINTNKKYIIFNKSHIFFNQIIKIDEVF